MLHVRLQRHVKLTCKRSKGKTEAAREERCALFFIFSPITGRSRHILQNVMGLAERAIIVVIHFYSDIPSSFRQMSSPLL